MLWDLLGCAIVFYIPQCTDYCVFFSLFFFYRVKNQCVYLIAAEGSGTPHYITACSNTNYDCSLSMQSGGPSNSRLLAKHFSLVVFRLSYVLYIMYRHSYLANKLLYYEAVLLRVPALCKSQSRRGVFFFFFILRNSSASLPGATSAFQGRDTRFGRRWKLFSPPPPLYDKHISRTG